MVNKPRILLEIDVHLMGANSELLLLLLFPICGLKNKILHSQKLFE